MKTKRFTTMMVFACVALFATHTAQAFYNPSTGRWLSRDPIEEKGGENIAAFVNNSPTDTIDLLGKKPCGDCGCDITAALNRTLDNVSHVFWKWDLWTQFSSCERLIDPNAALGAWDIAELKALGAKKKLGCDRTVMFNGNCHYGGAANYALYGRAFSLCNKKFGLISNVPFSTGTMVSAIIYYKMKHAEGGFTSEESHEAVPFALYGYAGFPSRWSAPGLSGCKANSKVAKNFAFHWHWLNGKLPSGKNKTVRCN